MRKEKTEEKRGIRTSKREGEMTKGKRGRCKGRGGMKKKERESRRGRKREERREDKGGKIEGKGD